MNNDRKPMGEEKTHTHQIYRKINELKCLGLFGNIVNEIETTQQ